MNSEEPHTSLPTFVLLGGLGTILSSIPTSIVLCAQNHLLWSNIWISIVNSCLVGVGVSLVIGSIWVIIGPRIAIIYAVYLPPLLRLFTRKDTKASFAIATVLFNTTISIMAMLMLVLVLCIGIGITVLTAQFDGSLIWNWNHL